MDENIQRRLDFLYFWEWRGLAAATEHGAVSIQTLYRRQAGGATGFPPVSRRPHPT